MSCSARSSFCSARRSHRGDRDSGEERRGSMSSDPFPRFVKEEITRKQLLARFTAGGALLALPGLLAACGGDEEEAAAPPPPAETGGGATAPAETAEETGGGAAGGRFTMARNEEPLSLDPIIPSDNGSI